MLSVDITYHGGNSQHIICAGVGYRDNCVSLLNEAGEVLASFEPADVAAFSIIAAL